MAFIVGCLLSHSWAVLVPVCGWAVAWFWVFTWRAGHCAVRGVALQPVILRLLIAVPSGVAFIALADEDMFNLVLVTFWVVLVHALCRKATKEVLDRFHIRVCRRCCFLMVAHWCTPPQSGDEDLLEAGRVASQTGASFVHVPPPPSFVATSNYIPLSASPVTAPSSYSAYPMQPLTSSSPSTRPPSSPLTLTATSASNASGVESSGLAEYRAAVQSVRAKYGL